MSKQISFNSDAICTWNVCLNYSASHRSTILFKKVHLASGWPNNAPEMHLSVKYAQINMKHIGFRFVALL